MSEICGLECKNLPMSIQEVYECLNHVSPLKQKANKQINAKSEKRNDFGKKKWSEEDNLICSMVPVKARS